MSILKSATWDQPGRGRLVRWTSTSERALAEEFVFTGKIIIICNSFPRNADAEAVRNRSLEIEIAPGLEETKTLLKSAISDRGKFQNQKLAQKVLKRLISGLTEETLTKVSYRTLQREYELAVHNPESWESLLKTTHLAGGLDNSPRQLIKKLSRTDMKVKDQLEEFEKKTGFKRRTFFKYRKQLGLSNEL